MVPPPRLPRVRKDLTYKVRDYTSDLSQVKPNLKLNCIETLHLSLIRCAFVPYSGVASSLTQMGLDLGVEV